MTPGPKETINSSVLERIFGYYRTGRGRHSALSECLRLATDRGPRQIRDLLGHLEPPWADHAIASVYSLLVPPAKRKRLGLYFTPPHLVEHLLNRMRGLGLDPSKHRIRDPAAGGAAFLVPLAREMVSAWVTEGIRKAQIVNRLSSRLVGREIDAGLAAIANALLRRMLVREFSLPRHLVRNLTVITLGNSLRTQGGGDVQHEVGNPPYLRLGAPAQRRWRKQFVDIARGRLNLYSMFARRALNEVPPGGLVGHILPSSFLGGPEFSAFRRRIMQLSEVLVLDRVEKRRDVFLDATQDACFLVLRRRGAPVDNPPSASASCGVLSHHGGFAVPASTSLSADGSPWSLAATEPSRPQVTLADYGYRGTVGYLVANRQGERLHRRAAKGRLPLIWAKSITSAGFDFNRGRHAKKARGLGFVTVPANATYAVRVPCVLVQRTSASCQAKRLTAAAVPASFLDRYGGIVGENHVIILVPIRPDAVEPSAVAEALNSDQANAALARVCGSASISVRLLERLLLPPPVVEVGVEAGALSFTVKPPVAVA